MKAKCIDIGNSWCPCQLASLNNCIQCRKLMNDELNGENKFSHAFDCNDCNWEGVCMYTQFIQDGKNVLSLRKSDRVFVSEVKYYSPELIVLVLRVGTGMAQRAMRMGSFVFLRRPDRGSDFDVPLSVLYTDLVSGEIHVAVNPCGPKTRDIIYGDGNSLALFAVEENVGELFEIKNEGLLMRGIYYSALCGTEGIRRDCKGSLVITKGLAIAPLRQILNHIGSGTSILGDRLGRESEANVKLLIDSEKLDTDFIKDYFGFLGIDKIKNVSLQNEAAKVAELIQNAYEDGWNIILLVSPYYYQLLGGDNYNPVRPNHKNMCCGEGICGACTYTDSDGKTVRSCKTRG